DFVVVNILEVDGITRPQAVVAVIADRPRQLAGHVPRHSPRLKVITWPRVEVSTSYEHRRLGVLVMLPCADTSELLTSNESDDVIHIAIPRDTDVCEFRFCHHYPFLPLLRRVRITKLTTHAGESDRLDCY